MRSRTRRYLRRATSDYDAFLRRGNPDADLALALCYDAISGRVFGDAYPGGLVVELVEVYQDTSSVRVRHPSLADGEAVIVVCTDQPGAFSATPAPMTGCCIDESTGVISCTQGQWAYLNGQTIPAAALACTTDANGNRVCTITVGDGQFTLAACPQPPSHDESCCVDLEAMQLVCSDTESPLHGATVVNVAQTHADGLVTLAFVDAAGTPRNGRFYPCDAPPPRTCCYDVATGTIICDRAGGPADTSVSLIAMAPQADGSIMAMVDAPDLPDDFKHLPICGETPAPGCCYDATTETLTCPGSPMDGTAAGIIAAWEADGQIFVWAVWPGGGARMPLCPGQTECPPIFCCVNTQTMAYVCPGQPSLNGTPAPVQEILSENGYTWGVLDDGTKLPLCGTDCPPPRTCPECPSCPRGLWMSPDGTCVEEPKCPDCPPPNDCPPCDNCPKCPPGMLLHTATGRCVPVEKRPPDEFCPPWWKLAGYCCENCAVGRECSNCADDCDCKKAPAAPLRLMTRLPNPKSTRRKSRLFRGNR